MPGLDSFYEEEYSLIYNTGGVGFASSAVHKSLEKPFRSTDYFENVLELGAGLGQHRSFVRHSFREYVETDIRIKNLPSHGTPDIVQMQLDAQDLSPLQGRQFDRIIATCLLAHLPDPEKALASWANSLAPRGVLSLYIPSDPGVFLRLLQSVTVARKARRIGVDYWFVHHTEHRFHFEYLRQIVKSVLGSNAVSLRSYPIRGMSWQMSLWFVVQFQNGSTAPSNFGGNGEL